MEIRTLGPLEVLDGGEPVALGGRKQRALLAVLALSPGRAVSAARLIDDLWGEDAPDTAPKMVQIHVSAAAQGAAARRAADARARATSSTSRRRRSTPSAPRSCCAAGREALAAGDAGTARPSAWARRWRCGAGRRWPSSPSPSPPARRGAWRSCGSRCWRSGSRPSSPSAATPRWSGEIEALIARQPLRERARGQLDARPVPRRPPGRGARRLPGGPPGAGRGARHRALARAARPGAADPAAGPRPGGSPRRRRRGPPPSARRPPRPARPSSGGARSWPRCDGHLGAARGRRAAPRARDRRGRRRQDDAGGGLPGRGRRRGRRWSAAGQCVEQHGSSEAYMPVLEALDRHLPGARTAGPSSRCWSSGRPPGSRRCRGW